MTPHTAALLFGHANPLPEFTRDRRAELAADKAERARRVEIYAGRCLVRGNNQDYRNPAGSLFDTPVEVADDA